MGAAMKKTMALLACAGMAVAGCATPAYHLSVVRFGDVDVSGGRTVVNTAETMTDADEKTVRAITGTLPAGLELTENGQKLLVHSDRYRVLGSVTSRHEYTMNELVMLTLYWKPKFHPETSSALDTFCWAQAPLKVITLTLWNVVPFAWPCWAKYPSEDDNIVLHVGNLKRLTKAMGGNLMVLASRGNRQELNVSVSRDSVSAWSHVTQDATMTGFAVLDRGEP
jgi:hypothetical protein